MILDDDGYVKLQLRSFHGIRLQHFVSGLDEESPGGASMEGAYVSTIEGYTEWVSISAPVISLGWDWIYDPMRIPSMLVRQGTLRTNVMLLDNDGIEVGHLKTSVLLEAVLDCFDWQETVLGAIENRYSMHQTPVAHEISNRLE